jgi:4-hydroxy-tetrahydrodipicolinate synthase
MSSAPTSAPGRPFGRVLTAMVTPFAADGELDLDTAGKLAHQLVERGCDGLVINGTTGESPTTTDAEKADLVRAVVQAVGDRAAVVAGAGTYDTAHSVELARQSAQAGAHGLLVVTPYYSRPPQAGLIAHFTAVADATDLPVMLYDIPPRSVVPITGDSLYRLAQHPRIVAVKDAKGDLVASSWVTSRTNLAYYSGDDAATLPLLSIGGVGLVGTSTHFTGPVAKDMILAYERGDVAAALALHRQAMPLFTGIFRSPGTMLVKAGLRARGLPAGPVRSPLVDSGDDELNQLRQDAAAAGIVL